jgi:Domain of unknown function (DUF4380)
MSELSVQFDRGGPDEVVWLANGLLRIGLVPALGARILSLVVGERELLYRNPRLLDDRLHRLPAEALLPPVDGTLGSWRNYGGDKTWPAPQGWDGPDQWPGPPDEVLDSGTYEVGLDRATDHVVIALRSQIEPRTGLRLTRQVRLPAGRAGYSLILGFENALDRPVTWAIWNVTQVAGMAANAAGPDDGLYVGVDGRDGAVVDLLAGTGLPKHRRVSEDVVQIPVQDVVGKLGFPGATGWLAFAARGRVLCQRFEVRPGATYPDKGSRAEAWLEYPLDEPLVALGDLQPRDRVVECEVLGPLTTLAAGEQTKLTIEVDVAAAHGPVAAVTTAGCVSRRLLAAPDATGLRLTGRFGVFHPGELLLAWRSADGSELGEQGLGGVHPDRPVAIDVRAAAPPEASQAVLALELPGGERLVLDRCQLEIPDRRSP